MRADREQGDSADVELIRLRALTVADLPLLCRWLGEPHVHRWWHDSSEPAAVSAEYLPCIEGIEPTHPLIAELPAGPVAFAQWYRWADYPDHAGKVGAGADEAGFDYLIGEAALCGKGLGTRLVAVLIEHIRRQDPTVGGFVIDPEQANTASRRVLEKNGLRLVTVKQIDNPDGHPVGPSGIYRRRLEPVRPGRFEPVEPGGSSLSSPGSSSPAGSVGDLGRP